LVEREGGHNNGRGGGGIKGWITVVVVVKIDGDGNGIEGSGWQGQGWLLAMPDGNAVALAGGRGWQRVFPSEGG
jgi:hypothetical protein